METEDQYYQLPENTDQSIHRMIWALSIFFVALIMIVVLVVVNAQKIAAHIPFSAEQRFIRPYETAIRKWYPGESNDTLDHYLQTLSNELAAGMDMPPEIEIKVHYVDHDIVNAFATLGGHIFIFEGLLAEMPDENSLAMVLAHEITHIKNRDPVAAMGRGFAIQLLYGFITNDYSSSVDLVSASGEVGMSFFNREQEKQADLSALSALQNHYGHVSGFDEFFSHMLIELEDEGEEVELPEWLSSHPDLQKRIDYLKQEINDGGFDLGVKKSIPDDILTAAGLFPETE